MTDRSKFVCPKNTINFIARNREKIKTFPKRKAPILKDFITNANNPAKVKNVTAKWEEKSNSVTSEGKQSPKLVMHISKSDTEVSSERELSLDQYFDCIEISAKTSVAHLCDKAVQHDESELQQYPTVKPVNFSNYFNFKDKCDQVQFDHANPVDCGEFKDDNGLLNNDKQSNDVSIQTDSMLITGNTTSLSASKSKMKMKFSKNYRESSTSCSDLEHYPCLTRTVDDSCKTLTDKREELESNIDQSNLIVLSHRNSTEFHLDSPGFVKMKCNTMLCSSRYNLSKNLKKSPSFSGYLDVSRNHQLTQTDESLFELVNKKMQMEKSTDSPTDGFIEVESSDSLASKSTEMLFLK